MGYPTDYGNATVILPSRKTILILQSKHRSTLSVNMNAMYYVLGDCQYCHLASRELTCIVKRPIYVSIFFKSFYNLSYSLCFLSLFDVFSRLYRPCVLPPLLVYGMYTLNRANDYLYDLQASNECVSTQTLNNGRPPLRPAKFHNGGENNA